MSRVETWPFKNPPVSSHRESPTTVQQPNKPPPRPPLIFSPIVTRWIKSPWSQLFASGSASYWKQTRGNSCSKWSFGGVCWVGHLRDPPCHLPVPTGEDSSSCSIFLARSLCEGRIFHPDILSRFLLSLGKGRRSSQSAGSAGQGWSGAGGMEHSDLPQKRHLPADASDGCSFFPAVARLFLKGLTSGGVVWLLFFFKKSWAP